jgi:MFS family permease
MKQILKLNRRLDAPQELIFVRLLVTIGAATIVASSSLYFSSLGMSDSAIGLATGFIMLISLVFALFVPIILQKVDLTKILFFSTVSFSLALVLFGSIDKVFLVFIIYVATRILVSLFANAYSVLFHDESNSKSDYRKNRSLSSSINNFAWMVVPFFATLIISQYSFTVLYYCGAIISFLAAMILVIQKVPEVHKYRKSIDLNIIKNIRFYFSHSALRKIYFINVGINVWWTFIFVFFVLFMKEAGYSNTTIGIFLTLTQLPLFLFEFKSYILVDKFKYRIPYVVCYMIMTLTMTALLFFGINNATLFLVIITSLCLVFLEPSTEMYLYEHLRLKDEEKVQPIYETSEIIGSAFIRLLLGLTLVHFASTYTFGIMAVILVLLSLYSRTVKN